jgi:hypothetical protein
MGTFDDLIDKYILKFAVGIIVISVIAVIFGCIGHFSQVNKYNQQCLDDGHKEYECYSMLHGVRNGFRSP